MSLDSVIANPGRLKILSALAREDRLDFVHLRQRSALTDGNLSTHAKRLESAGLVAVEKNFRDGKPITTFTLTPQGRAALQSHVEQLISALTPVAGVVVEASANADDEWVD